MKAFHIGSVLLAALFVVLFIVFNQAVTENKPDQPNIGGPDALSVESNHPLARVQQQLKSAYNAYNQGDIETVKKQLNDASAGLKDPAISGNAKTRQEALGLLNEIGQLKKKLSQSPARHAERHEGAMSRLWHRSTALIEHEMQNLSKRWSETSTANETLKHLNDAKLHFSYAEHELFISRNTANANTEISTTLRYLDEAEKVAVPHIKAQIDAIKKDIKKLVDRHASSLTPIAEQKKIMDALNAATAAIQAVSQSSGPQIQKRLNTITDQMDTLKKEIGSLESKQQYEQILQRIHILIREL